MYAYCRWADDLADEIGDTAESLRLLAWWRGELDAMYAGRATHPVFAALAPTVAQYGIPRQPFSDLIDAFVQDQTVTRYRNWEELFGYCRNSANPVGRLVLYLCGYRDAARQRLSDATCTALQLANFWQDVTVDLLKDRVYIPLDVMERHGYTVEELFARRFTPAFAAVMREVVDQARELFLEGSAAFRHGGPAPGDRSGPVQPRRHAGAGEDRAAGLRRAAARARQFPRWSASACCSARWRAWPSQADGGRPDGHGRAILSILRAGGAQPRQELLLFVRPAFRPAAQGHVRHLRLHALLRRFERRTRRVARRRGPLAGGHGRGAPGPVRGPSRVARVSPHGAPFRHPARVFPADDRRHFVGSGAAHAWRRSTSCTATATRWRRWWG